ncbi:MAG TPA: hypothetical protein PK765_07075 [bacterium]|nr:hypothetical protein [bacterium]
MADSFEHESVRSAGHVVLVGQCGRYGTLWLYITKIIRMIGYLGRITLFRKPY